MEFARGELCINFRIRAPFLSCHGDVPSEWSNILRASTLENSPDGHMYWGQDVEGGQEGDADFCLVAGMDGSNPHAAYYYHSDFHASTVGYRPVLDPMPGEAVICFYTGRCVGGPIIEENEFDVVIKATKKFEEIAKEAGAGVRDGKHLIIAKEAAAAILHGPAGLKHPCMDSRTK